VLGERHGVRGRLRTAVDGHRQPARRRLEHELGDALAFRHREKNPLARRAEREETVERGAGEEIAERPEAVLVEGCSEIPQRGRRSGKRSTNHRLNSTSRDTGRSIKPIGGPEGPPTW
jgi:hypothetical protein